MKLLVLYKDASYLENLVDELELEDFHQITESYVSEIINKFPNGRFDVGYSEHITNTINTLAKAYRGKKSLLIAMHLEHQNAVSLIEHNVSVLLTDNEIVTKLNNSPTYKTTFVIKGLDDVNSLNNIKHVLANIQ